VLAAGTGCGSLRTLAAGDRFGRSARAAVAARRSPKREARGPSAAPSAEQRPSKHCPPMGQRVFRKRVPANRCNSASPVAAPVGARRAAGVTLKPVQEVLTDPRQHAGFLIG
jgi:hypothetical protein